MKLCYLVLIGALMAVPARAEVLLTDDSGQAVKLAAPARRIVSLAPHVTEILFAIGVGDRIVGTVDYSDYPPAAGKLPRVGSYDRVDVEAVAALKPDLIIGWTSGNAPAHLAKLKSLGLPLYLSQPEHIADVARAMEAFGRLTAAPQAAPAAAAFRSRLADLGRRYGQRPPVRMFYQIWDRPMMTVNGEQIISDAMRLCGGDNIFAKLPQLAPAVSEEAVLAANPEAIIASGMGAARPDWLDRWKRWPKLTAAGRDNLFFINPDIINRHSPRLLDGADEMCRQLEIVRSRRPK